MTNLLKLASGLPIYTKRGDLQAYAGTGQRFFVEMGPVMIYRANAAPGG